MYVFCIFDVFCTSFAFLMLELHNCKQTIKVEPEPSGHPFSFPSLSFSLLLSPSLSPSPSLSLLLSPLFSFSLLFSSLLFLFLSSSHSPPQSHLSSPIVCNNLLDGDNPITFFSNQLLFGFFDY